MTRFDAYVSSNDTPKSLCEEIETLKKELQLTREENTRLKNTVITLGNTIKEKKEMWDYFEHRYTKVSFCHADKCPMFPDHCTGERCIEWVDLVALLDKAAEEGKVQ